MNKKISVQIVNEEVEQIWMIGERMRQDEECKEKERKAIQACVAFYHLSNPYIHDMEYLDFNAWPARGCLKSV